MSRNVLDEIERFKKLVLQPAAVLIEGIDFTAINYGDETQKHVPAGSPSLITSRFGSAIIDRDTGEWRFIKQPYIRFAEVSHIPNLDWITVDLDFDEVKTATGKS